MLEKKKISLQLVPKHNKAGEWLRGEGGKKTGKRGGANNGEKVQPNCEKLDGRKKVEKSAGGRVSSVLVMVAFLMVKIRDGLSTLREEGRGGLCLPTASSGELQQHRPVTATSRLAAPLPVQAPSAIQVHGNLLMFCLLRVCQLLCSMFNCCSLNGFENNHSVGY